MDNYRELFSTQKKTNHTWSWIWCWSLKDKEQQNEEIANQPITRSFDSSLCTSRKQISQTPDSPFPSPNTQGRWGLVRQGGPAPAWFPSCISVHATGTPKSWRIQGHQFPDTYLVHEVGFFPSFHRTPVWILMCLSQAYPNDFIVIKT